MSTAVSTTPVTTPNPPPTRPDPGVPCVTCGQFPHPVDSVRSLDPELQLALPIMNRHVSPSNQGEATQDMVKRRRIVLHGRVINSSEIVEQLKEKEKDKAPKPVKKSKKVICLFNRSHAL